MKYKNKIMIGLVAIGLGSSLAMATTPIENALVKNANQAFDPSKDSIMGYSSEGRELFEFSTSDGQTLKALDINGLARIGDMVIGKTAELKAHGLHITSKEDNQRILKGEIDHPMNAGIIPVNGKVWPNGVVPYTAAGLGSAQQTALQYAIDHWHANTNIRFVPRTNQSDYLSIFRGSGCWSWIGKSGGAQQVSLGDGCYNSHAVHELGHAVGFHHEQVRMDRDNYVTIVWNNIRSDMQYNFNIYSSAEGRDYGTYDYYSVMHYFATAFSTNGQNTIVPRDSSVDLSRMGYMSVLSSTDKAAAASLYGGGGGGNTAPNANFTYNANNLVVSFTDTSTDDSGVTSRSWNFGDGQTSTSRNPSHTYAAAGSYTVQLTARDAQGLSNTKTSTVSVTSGGGGGNPALLSPTAGSTLSGSSQTFTWNAGYANQFWLYAGSSVGSSNYKSSGSLSGTSYTMTGLPTDGSTVYVRFWYNDGSWKNTDLTFTASNGNGGGNTAPVANFTFSTNNYVVSFNDNSTDDNGVTSRSWNFGDGQTSSSTNPSHTYSAAGTYSVTLTVNDAQGLSNSTTKTVSVTGGGGGADPVLLSPAVGSTLSGSSQTFTWNAGNANQFWLYAGSSVGSSSYKSSGSLSGTTYTMSGLPTDGSTVYVRFWYNDGSWKNIDYTYTAANGNGGGGTVTNKTKTGTISDSNIDDYAAFTAVAGTIQGNLTGPSGTDFELDLQRKDGTSWVTVASSTLSTSTESITYNATAAQYRFKIYRYSGTGNYTLNYSFTK